MTLKSTLDKLAKTHPSTANILAALLTAVNTLTAVHNLRVK